MELFLACFCENLNVSVGKYVSQWASILFPAVCANWQGAVGWHESGLLQVLFVPFFLPPSFLSPFLEKKKSHPLEMETGVCHRPRTLRRRVSWACVVEQPRAACSTGGHGGHSLGLLEGHWFTGHKGLHWTHAAPVGSSSQLLVSHLSPHSHGALYSFLVPLPRPPRSCLHPEFGFAESWPVASRPRIPGESPHPSLGSSTTLSPKGGVHSTHPMNCADPTASLLKSCSEPRGWGVGWGECEEEMGGAESRQEVIF